MLSIKAVCKSENNEEVTIIGLELQGYCLCMTKSGTIFHAKHEDLTIVDKEYMKSCAKESIDFKMADFLEKASARLDRIQSKQLTSIILELQEYRSKIEQGTFLRIKTMKIRNHYIWMCILWAIISMTNTILCVVNFVDGSLWQGVVNLLLAVPFSFVCGLLCEKAHEVRKHNQTCDWLHDIAEDLRKEAIERINPFDEIDKTQE